ncbi:MAG TPA: SDR family oxidoreductase [Chloroflexi bacterium]|nr:SDR family oxidoreductase [Chloroflexota bacterium]
MDLQLDNRIALVAAASQGLGYATALQLSREGALVAICSRNEARIAAAADAISTETGRPVLGVRADVTRPEDIQHLFERVIEEYGGLDILVTNAGGPPSGSFEEITEEMWREAIDLTLMSAVRLIRAALPHLRQSSVPAVLTITSYSVKQPIPNLVLSNSIRMAVIGLTKTLALELGHEGIRFNSILPGWTETERVHDLMEARAQRNGTSIEEELAKQSAASPFGRMATPQEFANVATFLCSPAASYLTGVMLPVDGGMYKGTL